MFLGYPKWQWYVAAIAILFVAPYIISPSSPNQEVHSIPYSDTNDSKQGSISKQINPDDLDFVCRASIAAIMGRPIERIKVKSISGPGGVEARETTYIRSSDGTRWTNRCYIKKDKVIWAYVENGEVGRWRNDPRDEQIRFEISGGKVVITQDFGGSSISEEFVR